MIEKMSTLDRLYHLRNELEAHNQLEHRGELGDLSAELKGLRGSSAWHLGYNPVSTLKGLIEVASPEAEGVWSVLWATDNYFSAVILTYYDGTVSVKTHRPFGDALPTKPV
jgi:hypothetical protein